MTPESLLFSRAQFAFTIGYHILWPAYTIGISGFIVVLSIFWLVTKKQVYCDLLRFWLHLFALGFAMGVVTGIVLSYEIGTNWSVFAERTSNVIGPFFAYEVLTAFFLEAGFIGVMLFGMNRVGAKLHFFASLMVALGAMLSAFWILAANSWMQTPAGFSVADGRFQIESWWQAVFNPSLPYRFAHMVTAAYITGTFVVIGICGYYLWRRQHLEFAKAGFSIAMWAALILVPLQLILGDLHGRNTLEYQPIKVAAMEGDWETRRGEPLVLFAWPNVHKERNDWSLEIPKLGSLILTHDWNGEVKGLKSVPPDQRPPVPFVFWAFRAMVGIWFVLFLIAVGGAILRWTGRLYDTRWFSAVCAFSSPLSFLAILSGWTVTEVGRQPWIVYGQLRTADAVSPIAASAVKGSLALFVVVYTVLLLAFFLYAGRAVFKGPAVSEPGERPDEVRPGLDSAAAGARMPRASDAPASME
ncbi:MAG TPA: cytochrome ubiquinol oxidase subunit I [Gammaproteobacteria bacterium]|nr:cytochrome ubiquinol oxidase subunit I [Gammaproteobacteria bacterium]